MANLDLPYIKTFRMLWFTPGMREVWGLPSLYLAGPGKTKTSRARFAAKVMGLRSKTLSPALHGEGAFGVVPVPTTINGKTYLVYARPSWVSEFRDDNDNDLPGVILLDEVLAAVASLRPPLLGLVDERMIGDTFLGEQVRVTAFTNSAEMCGTDPLNAPLANRFLHPMWQDPSIEETADYLANGTPLSQVQQELDPIAEQKRVMGLWEQYRAPVANLVASYLRANAGQIHVEPPPNDPRASGPWPSRRSWELAIRTMAGCQLHGLSAMETNAFVTAAIGEDAAAPFFTYVAQMDLPNPADVLDGKV